MIYPRIMVGEGGVFEIIYRDGTETWLNKVLDPITMLNYVNTTLLFYFFIGQIYQYTTVCYLKSLIKYWTIHI